MKQVLWPPAQGPFSHIAAIACHKLWRLSFFKCIRDNYALRRQVIAAGESRTRHRCDVGCCCDDVPCVVPVSLSAVAAGTTSVMGAPVGALLFSVEVTASYYLVRYRVATLTRGFPALSSIVAAVVLTQTFADLLLLLA